MVDRSGVLNLPILIEAPVLQLFAEGGPVVAQFLKNGVQYSVMVDAALFAYVVTNPNAFCAFNPSIKNEAGVHVVVASRSVPQILDLFADGAYGPMPPTAPYIFGLMTCEEVANLSRDFPACDEVLTILSQASTSAADVVMDMITRGACIASVQATIIALCAINGAFGPDSNTIGVLSSRAWMARHLDGAKRFSILRKGMKADTVFVSRSERLATSSSGDAGAKEFDKVVRSDLAETQGYAAYKISALLFSLILSFRIDVTLLAMLVGCGLFVLRNLTISPVLDQLLYLVCINASVHLTNLAMGYVHGELAMLTMLCLIVCFETVKMLFD